MPRSSTESPQIVQHRLSVEGADQLMLTGINDGNLQELARVCGCRVVLAPTEQALHAICEANRLIGNATLGV